jgi:hypothetical protein
MRFIETLPFRLTIQLKVAPRIAVRAKCRSIRRAVRREAARPLLFAAEGRLLAETVKLIAGQKNWPVRISNSCRQKTPE